MSKGIKHCAIMVCVIANLTFSSPALSLSSDRNQPAYMEADQVTINDQAGTSVYKGNVKLTQGSLKISADTLTILSDPEGTIQRYIAVGNPAVYSQRADDRDFDTVAKAEQITLKPEENIVELVGSARIEQERDVFTAAEIVYDANKGLFTANISDDPTGERVKIVIQPRAQEP